MAWREARRAKGRALLVVAMIALPVAALAFGTVVNETFKLSPDERADRLMGSAQAVLKWPSDGPVQQLPDQVQFVRTLTVTTAEEVATVPSEERLLALLPPGTRVITDQSGVLSLRTATGAAPVAVRLLDYADPLAGGIYRPLSGRAPATAEEVALTPAAARRLGVTEGGTVRLADGSRTLRVVGMVENPEDLSATTIVLRPGALPTDVLSPGSPNARRELAWLVSTPTPLSWEQVKQLNTHGVVAVSRLVLRQPPAPAEEYPDLIQREGASGLSAVVLIAGLAVLEIILLAGPAFAVSARRRRRDLALVAAAGGTPAHLRRIVLADGMVLGAVAAAVGVAVGIAVAAAGRPLIEHLSEVRSGAFRVYPLALAGLAVLAVTTGVLAALVPAWISARQDVVTTLAGRRGITRSHRRWAVLGAVLAAGGVVVAGVGAWRTNATIILAGLVVGELGMVVCTPAIVGLVARAGRWLPLAARIALRDTSRNRTAAAPAISAVMAAVVGSIAVGVVFGATTERARADYRTLSEPGDVGLVAEGKAGAGSSPARPEVLAALRNIMPAEEIHQVSAPSCGTADGPCFVEVQMAAERACPYQPKVLRRELSDAERRAARADPRCAGAGLSYTYFGGFTSDAGMTVIIAEAALAAVAKIPAEDIAEVAAALRSGAVVVDDSRYLVDGRVTLRVSTLTRSGEPGDQRSVTAPGFVLPSRPRAPITLMTEATARSLGLDVSPLVTVATTSRMPTVEEEDQLRAALGDSVWATVERPPQTDKTALVVLAIVAGVITLGAAAIATGLAAADGRADLTTLAAVGASPRVRRVLSLSQAGVIAGLGSLLGTVAGLGASTAVLAALNRGLADSWPAPTPYPLAVPWLNVTVALLVVPLIAMLGAGLLTRSRLPIERRL
jgi:putative ABC transport system permease protein